MESPLFQTILAKTATRADLHRRLGLIRQFVEKMLFVDGDKTTQTNIEAFIQEGKLTQSDAEFFRFLGPDFFSHFGKQNAYVLIDALDLTGNKIPTLIISAPVEITGVEAEQLGDFARRTFSKDLLIDIKVNPATLGGCGLSWHGVYYDFSLPYYIKKNREKLAKLVQTYAQN